MDLPINFDIGAPLVIFLIRIIIGITMLYYGWPKLIRSREQREIFEVLSFYPGPFVGTVIGIFELLGGVLMLTGIFTTEIAIVFGVILFIGAFYKVFSLRPFRQWGYEILLLILLYFVFALGPGAYAIAF
jgi:putative oxidoreductase